jgi:hypothetical protein
MSNPQAAHGTQLKLGDGATPEVFTNIDCIFEGPTGGGFAPQFIEARHHGTEDIIRRVSIVDKPALNFRAYYDSSDTQHGALVTAAKNGTKKNFKLVLTDAGAEEFTFGAYVSVSFESPVDGFQTISVTLAVDGAVTNA